MELFLLRHRRLISLPFCCHHVKDDWEILGLQKFKHFDQVRDVVAIDWPVIRHPELFENDAWENHPLYMLFGPTGDLERFRSSQLLNKVSSPFVKVDKPGIGRDLVQIPCDGSDVLVDRPLIVVQDRDQSLGVMGNIVQRLKRHATGKSRIPRQTNHVLFSSPHIPSGGHSQRRRKSRSGMPSAKAVVFALCSEHEAV